MPGRSQAMRKAGMLRQANQRTPILSQEVKVGKGSLVKNG